jgi:hypothetical protein
MRLVASGVYLLLGNLVTSSLKASKDSCDAFGSRSVMSLSPRPTRASRPRSSLKLARPFR